MHCLHPRVSADHEDLSTLYSASVGEDDSACQDFATADAFVDGPLLDDGLHDFGPVRRGLPSGWLRVLCPPSFSTILSSLLAVTSRLDAELPLSAHQELDHLTDLVQLLGPLLGPTWPGGRATGV